MEGVNLHTLLMVAISTVVIIVAMIVAINLGQRSVSRPRTEDYRQTFQRLISGHRAESKRIIKSLWKRLENGNQH